MVGIKVVVALVVAGAMAVGGWFLLDRTGGDAGGSGGGSGSDRAASPDAPSAEERAFAGLDVAREVELERDGRRRVLVHFVSKKKDLNRRFDELQGCVGTYHERGDYDLVQCYAYDSRKAIRMSDIDPDDGTMDWQCWRSFFSRPADGPGRGEIENPRYKKACPLAWSA